MHFIISIILEDYKHTPRGSPKPNALWPSRSRTRRSAKSTRTPPMLHKHILEWQAAHPHITWAVWIAVWAIVLAIIVWPDAVE